MKLLRPHQKKARIEIIPMIDTMFFLLVFFMIATLSMTMQKGMPVNLPSAVTATDKVLEEVSLSLTSNDVLYFNKDAITLADLKPRLAQVLTHHPETAVVINADEQVSHGRVIAVMDRVRQVGITNMAIATKPGTSE